MSGLQPTLSMSSSSPKKSTGEFVKMVATGIPWIGSVPAHWEIKRLLWTIISARNGIWGSDPDEENDIPCVRVADFNRATFRVSGEVPTLRSITSSERQGRLLKRGDLLLEKSGGGELQPVGAVSLYDSDISAVCSNFLARLVPHPNCESRFLAYLHAHLYSARVNVRSIKQTTGIQNLDAYSYFCERVPIPPLDEQRAIAAFLDRETSKIDELIEKKQNIIDRLNEQHHARIYAAVSGKLDQSSAKIDSGTEWLGMVSAHWKIKKVKYLTRILRGKFTHRPRNDPRMYDGPYPFIQTGNVATADKYIREYSQTLNEEGFAVSKQFPRGTLVMTIAANIGDMAILDFEACFPDSIVGFVPGADVSLDYLFFLFKGMRQALLSTATLNTQLNLNIERIGALTTVVPPKNEQRHIVVMLEVEHGKITATIRKIHEATRRLSEYRSVLISSAVTGQIAVRNYRKDAPCP